jgi:hypothetical protein
MNSSSPPNQPAIDDADETKNSFEKQVENKYRV